MIRVIDPKDLSLHFLNVKDDCLITADASYSLPDYVWTKEMLRIWAREVPAWLDKFDCDDISFLFKARMQSLHAAGHGKTDGVACGVVFYHRDRGGGHAICWVVTVINGEQKLIYIEPQTGEEICLSRQESESRWFVYA